MIAIFWQRYGTVSALDGKSYTELELDCAEREDIPIRAYELPHRDRELDLEDLLVVLRQHEDRGLIVQPCDDESELVAKVRRDLAALQEIDNACIGTRERSCLERSVGSAALLRNEFEMEHGDLDELHEPELLLDRIKRVREQDDHRAATKLTARAMYFALSNPDISKNRDALMSLADVCEQRAGSLAWQGRTQGPFGGISTAVLRCEIYRRWLDEPHSELLALKKEAELRYVNATLWGKKAIDAAIEGRHVYAREQLGRRDRSFALVESLARRYQRATYPARVESGQLAGVLRASGNYEGARPLYVEALHAAITPLELAIRKADLGLTEVAAATERCTKGAIGTGLGKLEEAVAILQSGTWTGWKVMVHRKYGLALALVNERQKAREFLQTAMIEGYRAGYNHQGALSSATLGALDQPTLLKLAVTG